MNKETPRLTVGENLNFLLTNRLPRRWLTLFMGRFSRIESPALTRLSAEAVVVEISQQDLNLIAGLCSWRK